MILVSAGHYLQAQGAQWKGNTEWKEAVVWRDIILSDLRHLGAPVPSVRLKDKVAFINDANPSVAVEIHFNSAINGKGKHVGKGSETLYYPGTIEKHNPSLRAKMLAEDLQEQLAKVFPPNRGAKEGWYRMDSPFRVDYQGDVDGEKEKPDYFLRKTNCTAIIVEPEFIHHIELIRERRDSGCAVIATALLAYLQEIDA